jgi:hypothetical protein
MPSTCEVVTAKSGFDGIAFARHHPHRMRTGEDLRQGSDVRLGASLSVGQVSVQRKENSHRRFPSPGESINGAPVDRSGHGDPKHAAFDTYPPPFAEG